MSHFTVSDSDQLLVGEMFGGWGSDHQHDFCSAVRVKCAPGKLNFSGFAKSYSQRLNASRQ